MRVGVVDCDSHNFPNLPLMKISSYHKQLGNIVKFADVGTYYDVLYVSKIFTESKEPDLPDYGVMFWGGSGYDLENQLPEEIEHCYPDYSLYPKLTKILPMVFSLVVVRGKIIHFVLHRKRRTYQ